jgi:ribosomal protein L22
MENKIETKKIEDYQTPETKKEVKEIVKKDKAIVRGLDLPISTKNAIYTCEFIKGKKIDDAINLLENVLKKKIVLPMRGEIPHRKGNVNVGRWPENSTKVFIKLLKCLNANAQVNGMENPYISEGISNLASRPHRRGGSQRFKRTHVLLVAREKKV